MAAKLLILLALIATVAHAVDDCKCDPPTELENSLLWDFFKNISSALEEPNYERLDAVLPGELSPLLECNCFEKTETRRKRKILPEVSEETQESADYSEESLDDRRTPKCPHGYVWFGILCVEEKFVMDRK